MLAMALLLPGRLLSGCGAAVLLCTVHLVAHASLATGATAAPHPPPPHAAAAAAELVDAAAYWSSSPNLGLDTVTVAGSFVGDENVALCDGSGCTSAIDAEVWAQSVKARLPARLPQQPTWLEVTPKAEAGTGVTGPTLRVPVNAPDVWFSLPVLASGLPASATVPLPQSSSIRVFGRSLAWESSPGACISAKARQPASSTALQLIPVAAAMTAPVTVTAANATCYEATFALASVPVGRYMAHVRTSWGQSASWLLEVGAKHAVPPRTPISVDADFGGDIARALAHAATLQHGGLLSLGGHVYTLNASLSIPTGSVLRGAGTLATTVRVASLTLTHLSTSVPSLACYPISIS